MNLWIDCEKKPITELLEFVVDNRGKSVPTTDKGHILIATNCIRNDHLYPKYEKIRYLSQETYETFFRSHPLPGDIIFVNKGTPGRVCLVPDPIDFCIAQDMIALRANKNLVDGHYLFAVLRSPMIQTQIHNTYVGDVIPHFKKQFMDRLLIPLPSMEIQKKIGEIYYTICDKIEVNRRINEQLEELAGALFKSWFVDFEPFKDGEFVDSELGMIPKGWKVGKLEELSSYISRGLTPKYDDNSDEIILGQTCVRNNIVTLNNGRKHKPKKKNEKWIQQWDVLINSTGVGSLGRVGVVYFDKNNVAIDSHITVVRPISSLYRHYIGRTLLSKQAEIENMAIGSTGQTELPKDSVKSMSVLLPNDEVLELFNKLIEPTCIIMYNNLEEITQLTTLRDTLLPKLMSGEIDVNEVKI